MPLAADVALVRSGARALHDEVICRWSRLRPCAPGLRMTSPAADVALVCLRPWALHDASCRWSRSCARVPGSRATLPAAGVTLAPHGLAQRHRQLLRRSCGLRPRASHDAFICRLPSATPPAADVALVCLRPRALHDAVIGCCWSRSCACAPWPRTSSPALEEEVLADLRPWASHDAVICPWPGSCACIPGPRTMPPAADAALVCLRHLSLVALVCLRLGRRTTLPAVDVALV